ncbi:hypothetical protein [Aeoliella sp.]|uniref:hypothetical protein n=1 Tax=Aeoliella sp. TaxID=2795800 RepID=UPI003CCBEAA7
MKRLPRLFWLMCTMATISCSPHAMAIYVDLVPSGDQWIWDNTPDTPRTSDAVSVWGITPGNIRAGLIQFDVLGAGGYTGADLLSAELRLNLRSSEDQVLQTTNIVDLSSGTQAIDAVTWNGYQAEHVGNELEANTSLGFHDDMVGASGGAVYSSFADASELGLIANMIDGSVADGLLTLSMFASDATNHDWTDGPGQLDNAPSILRLEFPGETPPCYVCDVDLSKARWVRTASAHPGDGLLVTNNPAIVADAPAVGLMEWDLSEITDDPAKLISAELTFTVVDESRTMNPGQIAGLIDTSGGPTIDEIDSSVEYATEYQGTELILEGLGVVPDTTGPLAGGETFTTLATEADLELIRNIMNGTDLMTMTLAGSDLLSPDGVTGQYWGDGVFGAAPTLTLTFIPEPSSVVILSLVVASGVILRFRNWRLQ